MKVVFITLNLGKGGAEKVFTTLVKSLNNVFEIHVVSIHSGGYYEKEIMNTNVNYYTLGGPDGNTFNYVVRFGKLIKKINPDVVISFLWYPNIISGLAAFFSKTKLIVSERSNHRIYLKENFKKKFLWKNILKLVYGKANLIIPNSVKMGENIITDFKVNPDKVKVIHNGIDFEKIDGLANEIINDFDFKKNIKYLMALGRLDEPKNYSMLLKSFKILSDRNSNVELLIIGDGLLKDKHFEEAKTLGIIEKVHFVGFKSNPYKYLKKADCYVMSSKIEGFPNALIEAMYITGKVVSTNCETGPDEIITNDEDGFLVRVDDYQQMAESIEKILYDNELQSKFYNNSRKKIKTFGKDKMIEKFERYIYEVGH